MKVYKLIFTIVLGINFSFLYAQTTIKVPEKYNGEYIGGLTSEGKAVFIGNNLDKPTIIVNSARGLLSALNKAKRGTHILIDGDINLSEYRNIEVPAGVTIYGNRGRDGAKGPLLYTTSNGVHPLFNVIGDDVTFFGLRIRGADGGKYFKGKNAFKGKSEAQKKENYLDYYRKNMYVTPVSSGIATKRNNLTIENCELYQWTYTAIYLQKGAKNISIRYNNIHHNQRFGLGYGVHVDQAETEILANVFDYNRHSIASTGREGSIYIVQYNVFKEGGNETWAVDVHGEKDWGLKGNLAGEYIEVKNNTFYLKGLARAVVVRGVPARESVIAENEIIRLDNQDTSPIEQRNGKGNLIKKGNLVKSNHK